MKRTRIEDKKLQTHLTFCAATYEAATKYIDQVP